MNKPVVFALVAAALAGASSCAQAKVRIAVDLDNQTMHVEAKDKTFDWKVSSGKSGYETPTGTYGVLWMDKDHKSQEYDNAPMPSAIFFAPGYAIHGAYKSDFGHPASHGCIRLPVSKAAALYDLVKAEGAEVTITGESTGTVASDNPRGRARGAMGDDGFADGYGRSNGYGQDFDQAYDRDAGRGYYGDVRGAGLPTGRSSYATPYYPGY